MIARFQDFDRSMLALDQLRRHFDEAFLQAEREPDRASQDGPALDLYDTGEAYVVKADLPGVSEKDLSITLHQDVVTLKATRQNKPLEGYQPHRRERGNVSFVRSFAVPTAVDPERVAASLKDGVLTLTLEKAKIAQPRTINVKTGG